MNVIKTELKDKIMVTRERFNQLRQRKRNQTTKLGFALATTRNCLIVNPLTYRSTNTLHEHRDSEENRRNQSVSSDQLDRDEEAFPVENVVTSSSPRKPT